MSTDAHYDLIISGAGMVGASLALAARQSGLRVALFEKRPQSVCALADPLERASLVANGSQRFLQELGIDLSTHGSKVERMRVWDAENSGSIHLDAEEAGETFLGHIVENRRLEQQLHAALAEAGVNIRMIDQGSSEWNIIIGVKNDDFEAAVKAIYDIFVMTEL